MATAPRVGLRLPRSEARYQTAQPARALAGGLGTPWSGVGSLVAITPARDTKSLRRSALSHAGPIDLNRSKLTNVTRRVLVCAWALRRLAFGLANNEVEMFGDA